MGNKDNKLTKFGVRELDLEQLRGLSFTVRTRSGVLAKKLLEEKKGLKKCEEKKKKKKRVK